VVYGIKCLMKSVIIEWSGNYLENVSKIKSV